MSDIDTFEKLMNLQVTPSSSLKDALSELLKTNQLPILISNKTQLLEFIKKYAPLLNEFITSNYNLESSYLGLADHLLTNICHLEFPLADILKTILTQPYLDLKIGAFLTHHPDILKAKLATYTEVKLIVDHIELELEEAFINHFFQPDFLSVIKRVFTDKNIIDQAINRFETSKYHQDFITMITAYAKKQRLPNTSQAPNNRTRRKDKNKQTKELSQNEFQNNTIKHLQNKLQVQEETILEQRQRIFDQDQQLLNQNQHLFAQNRKIEDLSRSNQEAYVNNLTLLNNLQAFQDAINSKDELLATKDSQLTNIYYQLTGMTTDLENQKTEVRAKTAEVEQLQHFVDFLKASSARVTKDAMQKNSKHTETSNQLEKVNQHYTGLSAKYKELQQELTNKNHLLETKDAEIINLRTTFSKEKQLALDGNDVEIMVLKKSLNEAEQLAQQKETTLTSLQQENVTLMANFQQLLGDNKLQQEVTKFFMNESKNLQEWVDASKITAATDKEEIKSLKNTNNDLVEEVAQAKLEILYLTSELNKQKNAMRKFVPSSPPISENDTANQLITSLQLANKEMTAHIHDLESQTTYRPGFYNTSALRKSRQLLPSSYTVPENKPTVRPKAITGLTTKTTVAKKSKIASEVETDLGNIREEQAKRPAC